MQIILTLYKLFLKNRKIKDTPQLILWDQNYFDNPTRKGNTRKENYRSISFIKKDIKIFNKILAN